MIIVEGPDGSGKTTLIGQLLDEAKSRRTALELQPRHFNSQMKPEVADLRDYVDKNLQKGFGPRIHDRFPLISEPIYGPTCRGHVQPGFNGDWYGRAWGRFCLIKPIVVLCLPPKAVVEANVNRLDQPEKARVSISAVYDQYSVLYQRECQWFFRWDYTKPALALFPYLFGLLSTNGGNS